jgi:hypothetical protein
MPCFSVTRSHFATSVILSMTFVAVQMFTSCSEPKHCPAFRNVVFDAWFPYEQGQRLVFVNSRQEKDTIGIVHVERSEAKEITSGFFKPDCAIYADMYGGGAMNLNIRCDLKVGAKPTSVGLAEFRFSGSSIGDTGIVQGPGADPLYKGAYYSSINLNGRTYAAVQLLEKDTAHIPGEGLYRVYLSKESGIIAYEKYPSHELWVKQ